MAVVGAAADVGGLLLSSCTKHSSFHGCSLMQKRSAFGAVSERSAVHSGVLLTPLQVEH